MGLDYKYLLYFQRGRLWDAVQGVAAVADPLEPGTRIQFPGGERIFPFGIWKFNDEQPKSSDGEFRFTTSLFFEEDAYVSEYIRDLYKKDPDRSPPEPDKGNKYSIGFIYLYVYNDLSRYTKGFTETDLALLDFQSAGTSMSLLFEESPSVRSLFRGLLEDYGGVGGVFDNEYEGRVFWWKGREVDLSIRSAYVSPTEIESLLKR